MIPGTPIPGNNFEEFDENYLVQINPCNDNLYEEL